VGKYEGEINSINTLLTITREQEHVYLQLPLQPKLRLYAHPEVEFYLRMIPVSITFNKDSQGQVTSLMFYQPGVTPFTANRVE
jgi:hypothetical protein